jgi:fructokinase
MEAWGLSTAALQTDPARPTGLVDVTLPGGEPRFEILADRAYDAIDAASIAAPSDAALVCHGTLALRSEPTRRALQQLCTMTGAPRFCDLNLRPPWDAEDVVEWSATRANWLKLNAAELERVGGAPCRNRDTCVDAARALRNARDLRTVLVTRGDEGAIAVTFDGGVHEAAAEPIDDFVDSVGAGDAFTAVSILGVLRGWTPADSLRRAVRFAARVCAQRGATSPDRALYASFLEDVVREERDG